MKTAMNRNREWLLKMAGAEDNCELSVGGLAHEVGMLQPASAHRSGTRVAFAKLIELRRRAKSLSVEDLAGQAEIDLEELVNIERGELLEIEPRTVFKLATQLQLPADKLMQLSGLAEPRDASIADAAVRFAARSKPIDELTREEQEALREFVKVLAGD